MSEIDPIGGLAKIARGEPMMLAVEAGGEPQLVYPTIRDVLAALSKLSDKVLPDLKSTEVTGAGNLVVVNLGLALEADRQDAPRLEGEAA